MPGAGPCQGWIFHTAWPVWVPKKCSPKTKLKFEINLVFRKTKFFETLHYSLFHYWLPCIILSWICRVEYQVKLI